MKFIKELGPVVAAYVLIIVGLLCIVVPAYQVWELYSNPQHITMFVDLFSNSIVQNTDANAEAVNNEFYRMLAWPVVGFLLLILARIGVWAIDSSTRLLEILRKNYEDEDS